MSCSGEDETNAASVLSQMSQSAQTTQQSENVITQQIDNSVIAHQCDVETTSTQGKVIHRLFFILKRVNIVATHLQNASNCSLDITTITLS